MAGRRSSRRDRTMASAFLRQVVGPFQTGFDLGGTGRHQAVRVLASTGFLGGYASGTGRRFWTGQLTSGCGRTAAGM